MATKTTTKTAVIQSGGKQYLVSDGATVKLDKIAADEGKKVTFKDVLLVNDGKKTSVGSPTVKSAQVEGEVVVQARHNKVWGVKMKPKKRQRKLFGHKQHYTEVKITKITG